MDGGVTRDQEIAEPKASRPHVVLLGAGASRAAVPNGDASGLGLPLMREIAVELDLFSDFPDDLRELAEEDFEAAFSTLVERDQAAAAPIEDAITGYFNRLRLPNEASLYDALLLSLRRKDAVFTFNWDPLLYHSRVRLNQFGLNEDLPHIFNLHGNVTAAYCENDGTFGYRGGTCSTCGSPFTPTRLLFPVEKKDYTSDPGIRAAWEAARDFFKHGFMLTVFGYSAPVTDVEAVALLRDAWKAGPTTEMDQMEIIHRPGAHEEELLEHWERFIFTDHYELHGSFHESWLARHPRRSAEAHWNVFWAANFIDDNPIPVEENLSRLVAWFEALIEAERAGGV